ncbi:thiamine pyrophosphokinase [Holotrichia oblita]|uniref:Thiamine pyrophosphokinase n=1 Tax=Holotrichia oblita TaxID=644536 RepID=A0ACB9SHT8_HOLOL|nr:thiamine pyrophosphokinase [Holotrichia oblita]
MSKILKILRSINTPYPQSKYYRKFIIDDVQIGLVRPEVARELQPYRDVFNVEENQVSLNQNLDSYDKRSVAVENVLKQLKVEDKFVALKGWRNECYEVRASYDSKPLLKMDRSSTCLFGIKNYGINVNGYVEHPVYGLCLWLQKRSEHKQRWAGYWDTIVGGGISTGQTVLGTVYKECVEEASIGTEYHKNIVSVGTASTFYECEEGIFPDVAFVFDLALPLDFVPKNVDGEVDSFKLVPVKDCLKIIEDGRFNKTIVCVAVDFCIRHSVITPDNNPYYLGIVEMLHLEIERLYQRE